MSMAPTTTTTVDITNIATGGEGVGRLEDGRAVFVRGALPGERVAVSVTEVKKSFARAELVEVAAPSPDRVAPPCPLVPEGCGGCGWQHVAPAAQVTLKQRIVADALTRIGKLADIPQITAGAGLPGTGWRTTVRAAVGPDGTAGLRRHHAHDLVPLAGHGCLVAHPLVDEVLRLGRFPGAREVTVRAGARTGDRLVVVSPKAGGNVEVPDGVTVVGRDLLKQGHRSWYFEEAAGRRWRISAESFFQGSPEAAEVLVDTVEAALGGPPAAGEALVDLYAGVGLFAGALAARTPGGDLRVTAVEANKAAAADTRVNLADLPGARVVTVDVRRWRPAPAAMVVADPSRHGLGDEAVGRITATDAGRLAVVSCDAAALGRDAGLLVAAGWELRTVTLVDMFPHTPHVEVVTGWARPG